MFTILLLISMPFMQGVIFLWVEQIHSVDARVSKGGSV